MNPYDFVRINWSKPPVRRTPVWHHKLTGDQERPVYSGTFEVDLNSLTPFFISDPRNVSQDPRRPAQFMHRVDEHGAITYIIPGSSLKGMLRSVVESLGNGCLTLYDGAYERNKGTFQADYKRNVAPAFYHCEHHSRLCLTCRMFGMLKEQRSEIFLGKVTVSDALASAENVARYEPMYTQLLMEPKPHHDAFYLDEKRQYIAGRKFYFHHSSDIPPASAPGPIRNGGVTNRYLQPLDYDSRFTFRINFTNLETDELGALLLAVTLNEKMRHKIGYGKPLGLGSVELIPRHLALIDYRQRYSCQGRMSGKTIYEGNDFWTFCYTQLDAFETDYMVEEAMEDLQRIWQWPPDPDIDYYYPSKRDWFDTPKGRGKRISDTLYSD